MSWNEVFAGPIAQFPRTPLMHRGPSKAVSRPPRNHLSIFSENIITVYLVGLLTVLWNDVFFFLISLFLDGHPADDLDAQSTSDADFVDITEKDKLRSRSKKALLEKDKKESGKKEGDGKKTKKKKAVICFNTSVLNF